MDLPATSRRATWRRSLRLLAAIRHEQTAPAKFYSLLAEDTAQLLQALGTDLNRPLASARVLDVGGGPGYFAAEFAARGAQYITVEPDAGEMSAAGIKIPQAIRGSGAALPLAAEVFDISYSSNVLEHVPDPWAMAAEMLRVTRPGGLVILSYTVWLGPFGGHETGMWAHYVGGDFAKRRYQAKYGRLPKNIFGTSLFAVSAREGLHWARHDAPSSQGRLLAAFPRYHPRWAWWVTKIPVLREFLVSNLVLVLQKG
ncbi:class I SAM-dependent methyltransferase [Corynebacterium caspium]|uniref:class I SAM-dependent methyltransferase n=1 Tax=Corynebacterium caspium TaxID=234828 RepID=UPI000368B215|nr:class I SAM-dependent methyltransferase [Corynebacterium caspium]WKD59960.1 putative methyltransferase [Corynebacterium caspium DSM 44850]